MGRDHVDGILEQWARERPELDARPMGVVGRALRCAKIFQREIMRTISTHDLSFGEFDVLAVLLRSGPPYALTPKRLLESLMLSSGALTNRIDGLERAGLVARDPDASDRGGVVVSLTSAGTERIDQAVADHVANYYPRRFDIEWTAIALAYYWQEPTWTNRFGEVYSFDSLAVELLSRKVRRQSCGGMHVVRALGCLLAEGGEHVSAESKQGVRTYWVEAMRQDAPLVPAEKVLRIKWVDGVPRLQRDQGPSMLITGHAVELLFSVLPQLLGAARPGRDSIDWLRGRLSRYSEMPELPSDEICDVTHAFRAVSIAYRSFVLQDQSNPRRREK